MRYYIAATVSRWEDHHVVRDLLNEAGHEITYDWTLHGDNGNLQGLNKETRERVAKLECQAVQQADFVVALVPGGNGTNSEVGMAAVLGKKTYLHSFDPAHFEMDTCINNFYWHHKATRSTAESLEAFVAEVIEAVRPKPPSKAEYKPHNDVQAQCKHTHVEDYNRNLPLRYGSYRTEKCPDCGAWRTRTQFETASGTWRARPSSDWWHYNNLDEEIDRIHASEKEYGW